MTQSIEEVIASSELAVLVDFYAEWCSPCMQMMPVWDEVSEALKEKCLTIKVNVDEHLDLVEKYKIMGVPTFILFREGRIIKKIPGVLDKQQLIDLSFA
ncbi:MAG: thioredoxin family protein [Cytophagaceae bacterium]